jgi:hypothetical protein
MRYLYTEPQIWMMRATPEDHQRLKALIDNMDIDEVHSSDLLTNVVYALYTAVIAHHSGDIEKTESTLQHLLKLFTKDNISLYTTVPQIAFAAEIAFELWEIQPENETRRQLTQGLYAKLKMMSGFIYGSRPVLARFTAWKSYLEGKPCQHHFEKSIQLAQQYHMPYDEALARYHLGRLVSKQGSQLDTAP